MNIRRLLAAGGVVLALTPAALAAVLSNGNSERGAVAARITDFVTTHLALHEAGSLIRLPAGQADADGQPAAANTDSPGSASLAAVIVGTLSEERLSRRVASLALGGGAGAPRDLAGELGVAPPIGDPMLTPAQDPVAASGGTAGDGASNVGSARSARFASRGGVGAGGSGTGADSGETAEADEGVLPVEAQGGPALPPGDGTPFVSQQYSLIPIDRIRESSSSIDDSIDDLVEAQGRATSGDEVVPTPLPTSLCLLLAALAGLAFVGRGSARQLECAPIVSPRRR